MFVPLDSAAWPAPGEVRDLRLSLNAPVLLGQGEGTEATRAALGWIPGAGPAAAVRLWLRPERDPGSVRVFELRDRPLGPAARATALERAESFLAGLGFLFAELGDEADFARPVADEADFARPAPCVERPAAPASTRTSDPDLSTRTSDPDLSTRTSDPDPAPKPAAARPAAGVAVRADVRLTKFRPRPGHAGTVRRSSPARSPRSLLGRLFRYWGSRSGGVQT